MSNTMTIGFLRDNGDFVILATLNNNDGNITDTLFGVLVHHVQRTLADATGKEVVAIERQDTPDYINLD